MKRRNWPKYSDFPLLTNITTSSNGYRDFYALHGFVAPILWVEVSENGQSEQPRKFAHELMLTTLAEVRRAAHHNKNSITLWFTEL